MKNRLHHIALCLLTALTLLPALTSCERKDLYLRVDQTQIEIAVYDIRLDLLWGVDWQAQWQYDWDETLYGPIGYSAPSYVRASIYDVDPARDSIRTNCYTRNFPAVGGRVSLNAGAWYDMLFFNTGTEYTIFDQHQKYEYYNATTRTSNDVPVINRGQSEGEDGTTADKDYVGYRQPDELFGTFMSRMLVSESPDDYEKVFDEETGQMFYLYNIRAEMMPYSFIYMLQVMVVNNADSLGRPIISIPHAVAPGDTVRRAAKGMTLTGVAQGVELFSRANYSQGVSLTVDEPDIRYMQSRTMTLPDGTSAEGGIFASRLLTWGLPGHLKKRVYSLLQ